MWCGFDVDIDKVTNFTNKLNNMIQQNELRIGNKISRQDIGDNHARIETVLELGKKVLTTSAGSLSVFCNYDEIEPIELTEEWIIKFGFISNRRLREKQFKSKAVDGDVRLTLWVGTNGKGFYYSDVIQVKFVHQLQNLYYSISGEELKLS